ncbi:MAG: hypothetical protein IT431_13050 [Phycisphaerales bacterium]|nr:hypothetical protein [Phycisphaerales bacterium]
MSGTPEPNPEPNPEQVLPTWQLRARAPASAEWQEYRIAAASVSQAATILRRRGFVVDGSGGRMVDAPAVDPESLQPIPGPLHCTRCGYELDGLLVHRAIIKCPECAHPQVLLAFRPSGSEDAISQSLDQRGSYWWPFGIGCLTGLVLLLAGIALLIAVFAV